ncbi:MAG: substrate-binding domain-containing protein, partial [Pseudomonadota bacterium]
AIGAELGRGGTEAEGWAYSLRDEDGGLAQISAFSGGSQEGLADLIAGEADLAIVTRPMTEAEAAALMPGGLSALRAAGLESILATDGMVVVTDASVGVMSIRLEDVARIFAGEIQNWAAIGGPDLPITAFAREQGSGTRDVFTELILQPFGRSMADRVIGVDNDKGIADAVVAFPGSIGVTSYYSAAGARALDLEGACGLVAAPDPFEMQTGRYPLTRYLYAYRAPGAPDALADGLLAFLQSQAGQQALSAMGYIGQRITSEGLEAQRARLALAMAEPPEEALLGPLRTMIETLISAERISPTFRPDGPRGGAVLAAEHGRRLAEEIAAGTFDGRELLFLGFTDPAAPAAGAALSESLAAAEAVRDAVLAAAPEIGGSASVALSAYGFGGLAPLACGGTPLGRDINRRVEVWTRPLPEGG